MITVDNLLKQISQNIKVVEQGIPSKDKRILVSLSNQVDQGNFLTENQSNLLVKILQENKVFLKQHFSGFDETLEKSSWSQPFRIVHRVRKIYLGNVPYETINIEFTYDKRVKTKLSTLTSKIDGNISATGPRHYTIQLTEKNVYVVVKEFLRDHFSIDQKIMDFYHEIEKIRKNHKSPFSVFSLENENLKRIIEADIGAIEPSNLLLLQDRKIRYQYEISEKFPGNSLKISIANRTSRSVYVDSRRNNFSSLLDALHDLKRLPALVVFDGHDVKSDRKILDFLEEGLKNSSVAGNVGIYFRFNSVADTCGFNESIKKLGYNKDLDNDTLIAGIANSKIPKFMVKNGWKPQTVISFVTNFKNNKSYVYASDTDLLVYYGEKKPLHGGVDVIV